MRTSYATDTTAVGGGELPVNKYGNTAAYGNAPVASNGYHTQTTTHVPVGNGVSHDGYVRNQNATGTF